MQDAIIGVSELGLTVANAQWLEVLLTEEGDLQEFINLLSTSHNEGEALSDFHTLKVNRSTITEQEFVEKYRSNPVYALQSLFMYPVNLKIVMTLEERLHSGELTLEALYQAHVKYPYRNLYRFVL